MTRGIIDTFYNDFSDPVNVMTLTIARDDGQTDGLLPWHCETDTMQQQCLQLSSESFHQLYGKVYAFAMMHASRSE